MVIPEVEEQLKQLKVENVVLMGIEVYKKFNMVDQWVLFRCYFFQNCWFCWLTVMVEKVFLVNLHNHLLFTETLTLGSGSRNRLWVVPLSLSPSCVTRKQRRKKPREKNGSENSCGREARERHFSPPGVRVAIFSRGFLLVVYIHVNTLLIYIFP